MSRKNLNKLLLFFVTPFITFFAIFVNTFQPAVASNAATKKKPDPQLFLNLLNDKNDFKKIYAIYNIAHHKLNAAEKLTRFTSHKNPYVRRAAIFSLGLLQHKPSLQRFKNALKDPDYGVRRAAIFALSNLQDEKALPLIAQALNDDDYLVRELTILTILRMNAKEYLPQLIKMLDDKSNRVKRTAALALGEFAEQIALEPLRNLYKKIQSQNIDETDLKIEKTLKKERNFSYNFSHFAQIIDQFARKAEIDIRINDEILYFINIHAKNPDNLDTFKVSMWGIETEDALRRIVNTVNGYYYIESGTINISTRHYLKFDTPLELEVVGALYRLGDKSTLPIIKNYLKTEKYKTRAKEILKKQR